MEERAERVTVDSPVDAAPGSGGDDDRAATVLRLGALATILAANYSVPATAGAHCFECMERGPGSYFTYCRPATYDPYNWGNCGPGIGYCTGGYCS